MPACVSVPGFSGTVLCLNDLQYPFSDVAALRAARSFAKEIAPVDCLLFNGDMYDFDVFSPKYPRSGKRFDGEKIQQEFEELHEILSDLRGAAKARQAIYVGGNHEERPTKLIQAILPQLDGLRGLRVDDMLRLRDLGIAYIPYLHGNGHVRLGDHYRGLVVLHGYQYRRRKKGDSALAHMARIDCSVMIGHVNSCVVVKDRRPMRTLFGVEAGCLCSDKAMAAQYHPWPDSQQGLGFAVMGKGKLEHAAAVPIENGVIYWGKQVIR